MPVMTVVRGGTLGDNIIILTNEPKFLDVCHKVAESALPLPEDVRERAGEAVADHAARAGERDTLDTFLADAQRREVKRAVGRSWGWGDRRLLTRMRDIGVAEDTCGPHLGADPALRHRFEHACAELEAGAFVHAHDTLEKKAGKRGTLVCNARGHEALVTQAKALAVSPLPLAPDARALAVQVLADDSRQRAERRRIERLLADLGGVLATRPDGDARQGSPEDDAGARDPSSAPSPSAGTQPHEAPAVWEARAEPVMEKVRALLADEGPARVHLDAVAGRREKTGVDLERIGFHLACRALSREWDALERRASRGWVGLRAPPAMARAPRRPWKRNAAIALLSPPDSHSRRQTS